MSEHPQPLPQADVLGTPENFDVDAWIAGAKIAERSVTVYSKPGLRAVHDDLARQYDIARAGRDATSADMSDSTLTDLIEKLDRVRAEFLSSAVTWYVRALDEDDLDSIRVAVEQAPVKHPGEQPEAPPALPEDADEPTRQAHEQAVQDYTVQLRTYVRQLADFQAFRNAHLIANATTLLRDAQGRETRDVTADQVLKLQKLLGAAQQQALLDSIAEAATDEPEVPVPFWHESSPDDQT